MKRMKNVQTLNIESPIVQSLGDMGVQFWKEISNSLIKALNEDSGQSFTVDLFKSFRRP